MRKEKEKRKNNPNLVLFLNHYFPLFLSPSLLRLLLLLGRLGFWVGPIELLFLSFGFSGGMLGSVLSELVFSTWFAVDGPEWPPYFIM
jgi:hypothetical protein